MTRPAAHVRSEKAGRAAALLFALALTLATALALAPATAQELGSGPATLVADRVEVDAAGRLIASGNVEALQGDVRMTASRIVYASGTGALSVEGPITIRQGEQAVVLADAAELSSDLRDGLLQSARLVLDRQLQLGAAEINRVGGRYTQLNKVVASSCEVCARNPIPLWQIRSSRVVHDQLERQLYFDNPRFEIYGVPVLYLPRLRLPDPTLERATGFLTPVFVQTDELGFGIKTPYFFALSDSRDLTLAPYISARSVTLEGRYRQAFRNGRLQFDGAISRDDILPGETRGYLFGAGTFSLPRQYRLSFDVEWASDGEYLDDYGYSGRNRLDSAITLVRTRRDFLLGGEVIRSFVPGSDYNDQTAPSLLGDVLFIRRFTPGALGGIGSVRVLAHGHERPIDDDVSGRDVGRLEAELGWRNSVVGPAGLLLTAEGRLLAQYDRYVDDSTNPDPETRLIPAAALELRWPWTKAGRGASHVLEPVAQVVWTSDTALTDRPNEESRQVALDEGNLFSFSRFPAGDRVEAGLRANLGLGYTRHDPDGWSLDLTFGRTVRAEDNGQFDAYDAFDGLTTDWLLAASIDVSDRFTFAGRALIDDDFEADRLDTRLGWRGERLDLGSGYTWYAPEPFEDTTDTVNQWSLDAALRLNDRWLYSADIIYDLARDRTAEAELGIEYRANCITMDVGLRQRFTAIDQQDPSTSVSFQIALAGFGGTSDGPRPRNRACLR